MFYSPGLILFKLVLDNQINIYVINAVYNGFTSPYGKGIFFILYMFHIFQPMFVSIGWGIAV